VAALASPGRKTGPPAAGKRSELLAGQLVEGIPAVAADGTVTVTCADERGHPGRGRRGRCLISLADVPAASAVRSGAEA
jgi:hypothetical protein